MALSKQQLDELTVEEIRRRLVEANDADAARLLAILEKVAARSDSVAAADLIDEIAKRRSKRRKAGA